MLLHLHFKKYLPATPQSSYVPLSGQPDDIIFLTSRIVRGLKHELTLGLSFILLEKLGVGGSNQNPVSQAVIADTFLPVHEDQAQMCDALHSQERVRASQREDSTDNLLPNGSFFIDETTHETLTPC